MAERSLVSVVLPTRDRAGFLPAAIESVLGQDYEALELIVVDDASADDTAGVVAAAGDPRVRYVRLDRPAGAARARNEGIARARGGIVAFQDSDDEWLPGKLRRQVAALGPAGVVASVCTVEVDAGGRRDVLHHGDGIVPGGEVLRRLVHGAGYGTVSLVVRRAALERVGGFDVRLPRLQDYDLTLRLARAGAFAFVGEPLVRARVGPGSISDSADRFVRAAEIVARTHADLFARHPRGRSHLWFRAGKYLAAEGRLGEARRWFARAVRAHPGNLKAAAGWALAATGTYGAVVGRRGGRGRSGGAGDDADAGGCT